ncbi:hypothetical protein [Nitrosospira sp. NpAV]|uniref:hypothetical protein n=1 Tax=Nitrosospira sp. NpAV TaxID=58133 RepID=UPI00059F835D|nr:hypothetical protein [Nitrosospira sp. NpAV]KIO48205.1 hypothetical protein SQ11_13705 [Nitrosospira sp. NpAV]
MDPILQTHKKCHSSSIGTWSQSGFDITVSHTAHGALPGDKYAFYPSPGTGTLAATGIYDIVAVADANTLTLSSTISSIGTGTMRGTETQTLFSGIVPAGSMGENGGLQVYTRHAHKNSPSSKIFKVYFGGVEFTSYSASTTSISGAMAFILNLTETSQQIASGTPSGVTAAAGNYTGGSGTWNTAVVDTRINQLLEIMVVKASGSDNAYLASIDVILVPSLT